MHPAEIWMTGLFLLSSWVFLHWNWLKLMEDQVLLQVNIEKYSFTTRQLCETPLLMWLKIAIRTHDEKSRLISKVLGEQQKHTFGSICITASIPSLILALHCISVAHLQIILEFWLCWQNSGAALDNRGGASAKLVTLIAEARARLLSTNHQIINSVVA